MYVRTIDFGSASLADLGHMLLLELRPYSSSQTELKRFRTGRVVDLMRPYCRATMQITQASHRSVKVSLCGDEKMGTRRDGHVEERSHAGVILPHCHCRWCQHISLGVDCVAGTRERLQTLELATDVDGASRWDGGASFVERGISRSASQGEGGAWQAVDLLREEGCGGATQATDLPAPGTKALSTLTMEAASTPCARPARGRTSTEAQWTSAPRGTRMPSGETT